MSRRLIYMLAALLCLGYASFQPAVFLTIDTMEPEFNAPTSYPAAVDPIAPSVITQVAGASDFWVVTRDTGSGVSSGTVRCTSNDNEYDSGLMALAYSEELVISGIVWEVWTWNAPTLEEGRIYAFEWRIQDQATNEGLLVTYGGYSDGDGYFVVNGVTIASTTQTLYLSTRTIDVTFVATENVAMITGITVKVKTESGFVLKGEQLSKTSDTEWEALDFYTFVDDGSYTVEGYIDESTKSILRMSFIQQVGDNTKPKEGFSLFRVGAAVIGLSLLVVVFRSREGEGEE